MKLTTGLRVLVLLQYQTQAVKAFSIQKLTSQSFSIKSQNKLSSSSIHRHPFVPRGGGSFSSSSEQYASVHKEDKISHQRNQDENEPAIESFLSNGIKEAAQSSVGITGQSIHTDSFGKIPYVNTATLTVNKEHRVIFILGGPGAGKGTQSEKIVDTYKCIHLSVGELLREERKRGDSQHAELIEECLVAGKIVPVEISLALVRSAMDRACLEGGVYGQPIFLVDGFPRNFDNLEGWTKVMPTAASTLGALVYDCPIEVLERRILGRAETSGRSDDNLESARKRFKTFQSQTMPVVHALEEVEKIQAKQSKDSIGMLHIQHIQGDGTVEEVWDNTKRAMNDFVKNDVLTGNAQLLRAISENNFDTYTKLCSREMLFEPGENTNEEYATSTPDDSQLRLSYERYELSHGSGLKSFVVDAEVEVIDGTKAVVTYERQLKNELGEITTHFKETRVWSHEPQGWLCIHFVRKPSSLS